MISGIASLVFIPLLSIFFVHIMWAFGSTYPVKDQKSLARTVVGFKGIEKMPPRLASFAVAIAVFAAGIWALAMTDTNPSMVLTLGGVVLALVFGLRGIVGFTPQWRAMTPEEPFAELDRRIYSPLCLCLGSGFAYLVYWRLTL